MFNNQWKKSENYYAFHFYAIYRRSLNLNAVKRVELPFRRGWTFKVIWNSKHKCMVYKNGAISLTSTKVNHFINLLQVYRYIWYTCIISYFVTDAFARSLWWWKKGLESWKGRRCTSCRSCLVSFLLCCCVIATLLLTTKSYAIAQEVIEITVLSVCQCVCMSTRFLEN